MADQAKEESRPARGGQARRSARLAAALKANLTRRKAQARQRAQLPEKPESPRR